MPFRSKRQMRAAFSGALGKKMQDDAHAWAHETKDIKKLPERVKKEKKK